MSRVIIWIVWLFLLFSFRLSSDGSNIAADQCLWQRTWNFTGCHGFHHIISAHSVYFGQTSRWISHWLLPGKFLDSIWWHSRETNVNILYRYFRDYGKRYSCGLYCWWSCALVVSFSFQLFPLGTFTSNHRTISAKAMAPVPIHC